MIKKAKLKIQVDDQGRYIVFPPEWNIDVESVIVEIEGNRLIVHRDVEKYIATFGIQAYLQVKTESGLTIEEQSNIDQNIKGGNPEFS